MVDVKRKKGMCRRKSKNIILDRAAKAPCKRRYKACRLSKTACESRHKASRSAETACNNRRKVSFIGTDGTMTLEAALVVPLVLCVFLSVIFIIRAVYAYGLIQHALNETASEIASSCYIYHVSGVKDIHDTARDGLNDRADIFGRQLDSFCDTFASGSLSDDGMNIVDDINSNPADELKNAVAYILSGALDKGKTFVVTPIVKLYMKKYLITEKTTDVNKRLKALFIKNGFDGLDFSQSAFFEDTDESIDIVVKYSIRLPLPIQFIGDMKLVQRSKVKAWMGGDETKGVLDGTVKSEDIWSLSNFQRGRKIQKLFGANLPSNFPVIAKFSSGNAVMIKSMDLTAGSYQMGDNVIKTLEGYIKSLSNYEGQEKPWGSSGVVISGKDIKSRELLLVIPENKLPDATERILTDMVNSALKKGVKLTIKRHGTKVIDEQTGSETDSENNVE